MTWEDAGNAEDTMRETEKWCQESVTRTNFTPGPLVLPRAPQAETFSTEPDAPSAKWDRAGRAQGPPVLHLGQQEEPPVRTLRRPKEPLLRRKYYLTYIVWEGKHGVLGA